jgi:hypothetical protein
MRTLHIERTFALNIATDVPPPLTSERCEESAGCIPVPEMDDVDPAFRLLKSTIGWFFSTGNGII